MKRRLVTLLLPIVTALSLAGSALTVSPVQANATACGIYGVTYLGRHSSTQFDGVVNLTVAIDVTRSYNQLGFCYDYFIQAWTSDHSWTNADPLDIRVWRCGGYYGNWFIVSSNGAPAIDTGWISTYGSCGPQADDHSNSPINDTTVKSSWAGSYWVQPYTSW